MSEEINALDYILPTVKQGVGGIDINNDDFNPEIVMHTNTVLRALNQMGIGVDGFKVEGNEEKWDDFLPNNQKILQDVKTYVSLSVKKIFDPPTSSIKLQAMNDVIKEARDRIFIEVNWNDSDYMSNKSSYFSMKEKVEEFLYSLKFDNLDYDYAKKYFKDNSVISVGGCTAVRQGKFVGRHLDWTYGNVVEFIVKTPKTNNFFKTLGVSGQINELTNAFMESGKETDLFKLIPFYLTDGINERGLFCEINVVPNEKGNTIGTIPNVYKQDEICSLMLVRYVLDNFDNAKIAAEYIRDYISVYVPNQLRNMGYEVHFMIADINNTYCLEFVNNRTIVTNIDQLPFLSNFFINGVTFNSDGKVYTPADVPNGHNPTLDNGITNKGSGLERHNLIIDHLSSHIINNISEMRKLMNKLMYTNTYKDINPKWYTEFVGGNLTVDSLPEAFSSVISREVEKFENRSRYSKQNTTWQTNHSSIYDLENLYLQIVVQEQVDTKHIFSLD